LAGQARRPIGAAGIIGTGTVVIGIGTRTGCAGICRIATTTRQAPQAVRAPTGKILPGLSADRARRPIAIAADSQDAAGGAGQRRRLPFLQDRRREEFGAYGDVLP
jgi:hypothetical protein